MLSLSLVFAAALLFACSGLPAFFLPRRSRLGQWAATLLMIAGSALGLAALGLAACGAGGQYSLSLEWRLPWGSFVAALDPLSSVFLVLIFIIPGLGSIYGLGYWRPSEKARSSRSLGLAFGLLAGAMVLVVVARDGMLFLIAWELMALAAFFASTAEDGREVRRAGWIYLIATHIGTLCLFAMFALWKRATGSFALVGASSVPIEAAGAIFILALIGFGFKAGFIPLHFWLPGAHANAPSHVSAVMSGVMLKMGIYGILRMTSLLPSPPVWWGATLLAVGALTGLAGIVFAIAQTDIKRVLAYSSVENIGIIAMGMGLALLGRALGRWELVLLGMGGALLHVWNHGLFKSLLFFGSGAVMHATGTRNMERLGGLAKLMPRAALLFLLGAVAICALPPLNGFASEWLLYLGFFSSLSSPSATNLVGADPAAIAAAGAAVLAMIGALAVACFVRLYSGVFLGEPRTEAVAKASEPGASMLLPMAVLALACLAIGALPSRLLPALEAAVRSWAGAAPSLAGAAVAGGAEAGAAFGPGAASLAQTAPLGWLSWAAFGLILLVALVFLMLRGVSRRQRRAVSTWDCGYAQPTARMQYTASSFGRSIVSLFSPLPEPKKGRLAVRGFFPKHERFEGVGTEGLLDHLLRPALRAAEGLLPRFRLLQRGQTHLYILYVLVATILLLAFAGLGVPL
jgi:hydrogenase-4 component B